MKANRFNFRAWNSSQGLSGVFSLGSYPKWGDCSSHHSPWNKNCIVMQSTGIADKNGVEIFEGDIVLHAVESNLTSKCTMKFGGAVCFDPFKARFSMNISDFNGMIYKAYEIIGNIHDNPELLEKDK